MKYSLLDDTLLLITQFVENKLITQGTISKSESLFASKRIDSIRIWELVSFIEQKIEQEIPVDDLILENFDSLEQIEAMLYRLFQTKSSDK